MDTLFLLKILMLDAQDDFFVCLNWAFPNRYTYPPLTLFDT